MHEGEWGSKGRCGVRLGESERTGEENLGVSQKCWVWREGGTGIRNGRMSGVREEGVGFEEEEVWSV